MGGEEIEKPNNILLRFTVSSLASYRVSPCSQPVFQNAPADSLARTDRARCSKVTFFV